MKIHRHGREIVPGFPGHGEHEIQCGVFGKIESLIFNDRVNFGKKGLGFISECSGYFRIPALTESRERVDAGVYQKLPELKFSDVFAQGSPDGPGEP